MPFQGQGTVATGLALLAMAFAAAACSKGESATAEAKPPVAPEVSLAGVDTSSLTPRERREWATQVSELLAPCPEVPVNLAQCVKESRPCKTCLPAVQLLLKQVQAGKAKKDREDAFHARFDPAKVRTLPTEGAPETGAPDGPVTVVEWADFECPYCRIVYPVLDDLVHKFPGQVRLVYKFYPLSGHPHGEIAARAAMAAFDQGKFWEMHHTLFDNQERLEQPDLERYAKQLGLDFARFKGDFVSKETGDRIAKSKKEADDLGLEGTPFLFIDGREVDLKLLTNPPEDLTDWVKLELELSGHTPKLAPAAPASASASATATTAAAQASVAPRASAAPGH